MGGSGDLVWVELIRDIRFGDTSRHYRSGSRWEVDPITAGALILVGAAVKVSA
jgi:hypothetical protein